MNVQIASINIRYDNEQAIDVVQVYFNATNAARSISTNGYVSFTAAEYAGNEAIGDLENLVKSKIVSNLTE